MQKEVASVVEHIILLDFYITHRCRVLTAYILVWEGAVVIIQIVLFYEGRASVYPVGCYFFGEYTANYQDSRI